MKYDDASWHYDADDFPKDLPKSASATHIGMFVTWAILNELMADEFQVDFNAPIQQLRLRQISPGQFVWRNMEGKFSDHDLSAKAKVFANNYYSSTKADSYLATYVSMFKGDLASEYQLPDTWETYDQVSRIIGVAYQKVSLDSNLDRGL